MIRPITIAGGGLAGLSLGIALVRRGASVTVHEAGSYPRHRVCGEFICGVDETTLDQLGVSPAISRAEKLTSAAWFRRDRKIFHAPLPKAAWGLSRHFLDNALQQEFRDAGGVIQENSRCKAEAADGLVWSAGRIPTAGTWLGLKCHLRDLPMEADLEMHLGHGCYLGLARIESDVVNICGLFRKEPSLTEKGIDLLFAYLKSGGLGDLAARLRRATEVPGSFLGVAGFQLGYQSANPHLLTIGDAFGMIPPFTGDGMSMAFESAEAALDPLSDYARDRMNWRSAVTSVRSALRRKFSRRMRWARTLHPFLTSDAGQLFLSSIARAGLLPYGQVFRALR